MIASFIRENGVLQEKLLVSERYFPELKQRYGERIVERKAPSKLTTQAFAVLEKWYNPEGLFVKLQLPSGSESVFQVSHEVYAGIDMVRK